MYKETIHSEGNPSYNNHTCNLCEGFMFGGDPMMTNHKNDTYVCTQCIMDAAESLVKLNLGGFYLFWLKGLEYKHFGSQRKNRNCYLPKNIRKQILKKYKFKCAKCDSKERLEIDHIKSISKGGTDHPKNLQVLCKTCNLKKGTGV
jgi:hypothetical protein